MSPPLSRFRVADLATVRSGPTCARVLGDFGAEGVRVERPGDLAGGRAFFARTPAPLPGQHTREVLVEGLGYDRMAVDALVAEGIVEEAKGENS